MLGTVDATLDADDDTLCCVIWDVRYPGEMDAIGLESLFGENNSASAAFVSVCCLLIIDARGRRPNPLLPPLLLMNVGVVFFTQCPRQILLCNINRLDF